MDGLRSKLQVQEGILYPIPYAERNIWGKLRPVILTMTACLVLFSIILRENLFKEIQPFLLVALIFMFLKVLFADTDRWGPSDMELYFYDDRLEIIRKRVLRSKGRFRYERDIMYYSAMKRCLYRKVSKQIEIHGENHGIYWEYMKDGNLKEKPSYDRVTDSLMSFYIQFMDVDMVIHEINKYTSLEVIERES